MSDPNPYSPRRIVEDLAKRGIALSLADGELVVQPADAVVLPADLIRISERRDSIMMFLRSPRRAAAP